MRKSRFYVNLLVLCALIICVSGMQSCKNGGGAKTGALSFKKETLKIGFILPNELDELSVYDWMHYKGIVEMQQKLALDDSQIIVKENVFEERATEVEAAALECITDGANVVIGASWGYMDVLEKMALEFPAVIFVHITGSKYHEPNFTNAAVDSSEARYLTGMLAGGMTKTNKIGFVAAMGTDNFEVTSGVNAFAMGVEAVNPDAEVHVRVIRSWIDIMGETDAANYLIDHGCDVITHHTNTATPIITAQKRGVPGIGFNGDMAFAAADNAKTSGVITSIVINWGVYYTQLVEKIIGGTFSTVPYFAGFESGIVEMAPLNGYIVPEHIAKTVEEKRKQMLNNEFQVFSAEEYEGLNRFEIFHNMNRYYRNVVEHEF